MKNNKNYTPLPQNFPEPEEHGIASNPHLFLLLSNAGNLEKLANELAYATIEEGPETEREGQEWDDRFVGLIAGVEVTSTHQRLLMVLSNVGFCHSTSLPEQTRKYEHVWTYEGSVSKTLDHNLAIVCFYVNQLLNPAWYVLNFFLSGGLVSHFICSSDTTSKGGNMATYEEVSNTLSELEKKVLNHYNVAKVKSEVHTEFFQVVVISLSFGFSFC